MTQDEPSVSVVVPTYNRVRMVAEALASVLAQTHADFELLVVDDGSTDETPAVLRRLAESDGRIQVVTKANGGTASARNAGLERARGPWTAFLDSDDLWRPTYLASQLAFASAHPQADAVLCDTLHHGGERDGETTFGRRRWRTPSSVDALCCGAWALPSSLMIRTDLLQRLRFSAEYQRAEDIEFLFRFHEAGGTLIENPDVLTVYRTHEGEAGEPQKVGAVDAQLRDHIAVLERYAGAAEHPKEARYQIARRRALRLVADGRWREARADLWTWWKRRPDSTKALRYLVRSLFSRTAAASDEPPAS